MSKLRDGVVLLHGLGRTSGKMRLLGRRLSNAGYAVDCPRYPSTKADLDAIAEFLEPKVRAFEDTVPGQIHFVSHSLGGLALRTLFARYRPNKLGRVVMLAPPHGGSEWADVLHRWKLSAMVLGPNSKHLVTERFASVRHNAPIDYPLGIVAGNRPIDILFAPLVMNGPHDGKVSVASTRLEGMADHIVLPVGHPLMPFHPHVARQAVAFLKGGAFAR